MSGHLFSSRAAVAPVCIHNPASWLRAWLIAAIAIGMLGSSVALAADVTAKKVIIKDHADPAKRKVQLQSADVAVTFAGADAPDVNGASVHVYSASDDLCVILPAGPEWQQKNSRWKYKDKVTKNQAQVADGKLKIKLKSGVSYTLADDGAQGSVNAQVQFGGGTLYCMSCTAPSKDDSKIFLAKNCAAAPCDAEPSPCSSAPTTTTTLPPTKCGDLAIDPGEDCELNADCASGETCTDRCYCIDAQCPEAIEWTSHAGVGVFSTSTEIDMGHTGFAHDLDVSDQVALTLAVSDLSGSGPASCGIATVAGVNPRAGNCRCASDNRTICDEPFVSDTDDCGGGLCTCYQAPPEPHDFPFCAVRALSGDITGTWNVDTGAAELFVPERTRVYLGIQLVKPCPTCDGDASANDGLRDGTCVGGLNSGMDCDAHGTDATFPAPGGGAYSFDCFPDPGKNVSGPGLAAPHLLTTGGTALPFGLDCGNGFDDCPCRVCSGNNSVACSTNAECSDAGIGTCTGGGTAAPNSCFGGVCDDVGGGEGECNVGPDDSFCDGVLRANGQGFISCLADPDCSVGVLGFNAGNCTISQRRECFPDPITATGTADVSSPLLGGAYCAPSFGGIFVSAIGFPGAARVHLAGSTSFPCAGDPGSDYPACP